MGEVTFRIVTAGQLATGFDRHVVAANLARLCRYSPQQLQAVFSGQPFILKGGLTRQAAQPYMAALVKAGIVCNLVAEQEKSGIAISTRRPAVAPASIEQVRCPKCGEVQPKALSCRRCQVVMAKYRDRQSVQPMSDESLPSVDQGTDGFPFLKLLSVLLVVLVVAGWIVFSSPFTSKAGSLNETTGYYLNKHFGFSFTVPATWNYFTVDEAISCSTIRREYADNYLLLTSPTHYDQGMLVINISGITLDYFKQQGWENRVRETNQSHPVLYQSVDNIGGFKVYRVGYNIAQSYREDAYFETNDTLMHIYFYVRRSGDFLQRAVEMRAVVNDGLRVI